MNFKCLLHIFVKNVLLTLYALTIFYRFKDISKILLYDNALFKFYFIEQTFPA